MSAVNPLHAGHARVVNYSEIRRVTDGHYKIPWILMDEVGAAPLPLSFIRRWYIEEECRCCCVHARTLHMYVLRLVCVAFVLKGVVV